MTDPQPEFSRLVRLDQIGRHVDPVKITADAAERAGLVRRFGLIALDQLEADYALSQDEGAIIARGRVRAQLVQPCVATGGPVPETIDSPFTLRFVEESDTVEEIELDAEDCDTIGYEGGIIDMGEAVAETMALMMEPYSRTPDADAVLKDAGVLSEEQASPFAALLALKTKGHGGKG